MNKFEFFQFPCLSDNYGVLVHNPDNGDTISIDAPDAAAVWQALDSKNWRLSHILVTHHHWDHTQGIEELKRKTGCLVTGPAKEASKIPMLDRLVSHGDRFDFGGEQVEVIETPGHTLGMVNFHFPQNKVVFTGDTLFALGCGRIFEGDADMMWQSLMRLMVLPADTRVFCGHEYTQTNAEFALAIDPHNARLRERVEEIRTLRSQGRPTLPTRIGIELETNPFFRAANPAIRVHLGMENASDAEVFAQMRTRKDNM